MKRFFLAIFHPYKATDKEIDILNGRMGSQTFGVKNGEYILGQISALESKSGVLLTHISMMIAVTGLMLAISNNNFWLEALLALELVAYLMLALVCIRCQYQFDNVDFESIAVPDPNDANSARAWVHERQVKSEIFFRESLFRFSMKTLFVLTFLLSLTVLYGTFMTDETPQEITTQDRA